MLINFKFGLYSTFCAAEDLTKKYSLEQLNDWLSYESELKYLFYFGEGAGGGDSEGESSGTILDTSICLLRHNTILTNDEKMYILSLSIEDAQVVQEDGNATLHITLKSDHVVPVPFAFVNVLQFLCNHIYNQCQLGMFKYGIIQPLSEAEKDTFQWKDEPGWSLNFLEQHPLSIDALFLTRFTCVAPMSPNPIYLSNYNLACYELSQNIDEIENDLHRYKKSIKYLKKKQRELRKEKHQLYNIYRDNYLTMLTNENTKWFFESSCSSSCS
jgi:hypothetical protein